MSLRTFVSLFSGCGGGDIGFKKSGFKCLAAFDNDQAALRTYQRNFGSVAPRFADLALGLPDDPNFLRGVDVVLAGPPCQGFSLAGKLDPFDSRNTLLVKAAKLAVKLQPKFIVIENVAAAARHTAWNSAHRLLRDAGYTAQTHKWSADQYGVPQRRRRAFLIGAAPGYSFQPVAPKHVARTVVRDVLAQRASTTDHEPTELSADSRGRLISENIGAGMKLCNVRNSPNCVRSWDIAPVFGHVSASEREVLEAIVVLRRRGRVRNHGDADPVKATTVSKFMGRPASRILATLCAKNFIRRVNGRFDLLQTFNGKYRRLALDEPSPAVTTKFGDPSHFLHPTEHRALTVREAARIQGFPDEYIFLEAKSTALRMIGNAVPPPVAAAIAGQLRSALV